MGKSIIDTAEQIQMCLNCKLARCIDCLSLKSAGKDINEAEFMQLYKQGCTDIEIAKALSVCQETASKYRRAKGLAANRVKPVRTGRRKKNA